MNTLNLQTGDAVELLLPGVREWKIPATRKTVTIRDHEHAALVEADVREAIECGGATALVKRPGENPVSYSRDGVWTINKNNLED